MPVEVIFGSLVAAYLLVGAKMRASRESRFPKAAGLEIVAAFGLLTALLGVPEILDALHLSPGLYLGLDPFRAVVLALVSGLGVVVLRFAERQIDHRRRSLLSDMGSVLAAVTLLVVAERIDILMIGWLMTSVAVRGLLRRGEARPRVAQAIRSEFFASRLSDLALLVAAGCLYEATGEVRIDGIVAEISALATSETWLISAASVALVIAALAKSAQMPLHGWLLGIAGTPTPVSALMHAGVVNAGALLLLRFSPLIEASLPTQLGLATFGALNVVLGTLSMSAQTRVKDALAYSTVAQMGFVFIECAIGAYEAALLHLVAHALYKAHAFLSASGTLEQPKQRFEGIPRTTRTAFALRFAATAILFHGIAWMVVPDALGAPATSFSLAVLAFGAATFWTAGLEHARSRHAVPVELLYVPVVVAVYLALHELAGLVLPTRVGEPLLVSPYTLAVAAGTLLFFLFVGSAQWRPLEMTRTPFGQRLFVLARRGFHIDRIVDAQLASATRLLGKANAR